MISWVSVVTCAKRGQYLEATIESLESGGAALCNKRVLFVDGPAEGFLDRFPGWDVVSVSPVAARGARLAMVEIMRLAHAAGVQLLLYFEDDIQVCTNAIRAMLEIGVPRELGFVSYCDLLWHPCPPLELAAFPGCPREHPVADGGFVGCQALAIPARTLEAFTTWQAPPWLARDPNNCDGTMGQIAPRYGILDSLANHIGDMSAIMGLAYGPRLRVVRGWRGEDFDADTLPRTWTLGDPGERCTFHAGVLHADRRACASSHPDQARAGAASYA
jgi:hypothetical protein